MVGEKKTFQVVANIIMFLLLIICLFPFILLVTSSLTEESTLIRDGYALIPKKWSLGSYTYMLGQGDKIVRAYGITILVTFVGTVASMLLTILMAYPLSRKDLPFRNAFAFYVFFTMLFNGGVVPSYMMWTQVFGIKNTIWALIFPNLVANGFFIILYKNNFSMNIHPALIEAAKIDGAGEFFIYRKIVLPLSLPILATVGLMTGLGYWNDWTNGIYYITEERWYSLQVYLNSILSNVQAMQSMNGAAAGGQFPGVSIRMAMAVIGVVPILILYPFFQKYFVKGIAIGGVKE